MWEGGRECGREGGREGMWEGGREERSKEGGMDGREGKGPVTATLVIMSPHSRGQSRKSNGVRTLK